MRILGSSLSQRRSPTVACGRFRCLLVAGLATFFGLGIVVGDTQEPQSGESMFGRENYVEYRVGDLPVILVSGHGGHLRPDEIPDRTWGTTVRDRNTRELTEAMAAEIFALTGRRPHVIISHLRRIKLDPNREIVEAAQGNEFAEQAWREFHGFIQTARELAEAEFGFGFLMDVHGHGHEIQRLELGYGLARSALNLSDAELEEPRHAWNSSLRTLKLLRPEVPFSVLLRGPLSLGQLFNEAGVPAWPSADFPSPGSAPFFTGGYITQRHTCLVDNGPIHGVQLECHYAGIRDNSANRSAFAEKFAQALQPYLWDNYGYDLGTKSVYRIFYRTNSLEKGGPGLALMFERTGLLSYASSIELELGGTAVAGVDYTLPASTASFGVNENRTRLVLTPRPQNGETGDKTIELRLAPTPLQSADTSPVVIHLGDGAGQTVRVFAMKPEVMESDGEASFQVTRTVANESLEVHLEWAGEAFPGQDYNFTWELPTSVTFEPGVAELVIPLNLVNDALPEPDKAIVLRVLPGVDYQVGGAGEAAILVRDDDRPVGIEIWLRGEQAGNRLIDFSGHARHASTLPAGSGLDSLPTEQGVAFAFNGVNNAAALPKLPSGEAFSLAFFYRLAPSSGERNLISFGERGEAGSLNIYLASATNMRTWLVSSDGGGSSSARDVPGSFVGSWVHYALSVDAEGTSRIYLNGELRRTVSGWVGPLDPKEILWLGWRRGPTGSSAFLSGAIRDFRFYSQALSSAAISALATGSQTFESWREEHGLLENAMPSEGLAGDGLPLLLRYGLGAEPLTGTLLPRYRLDWVRGQATWSFLRNIYARDLVWQVEASDGLNHGWEVVAEKSSGPEPWLVGPGLEVNEESKLVTVRDLGGYGQSDQRFLRVRIQPKTP